MDRTSAAPVAATAREAGAAWLRLRRVISGDVAGVVAVLLLVVVSVARMTVGGTRIGLDAAVQFYPSYIFLGDSLRSGDIPFWNPHQFAGMPMLADLQSGWGYLPAMALFALFPIWLAIPLWLATHLAIASFGAYFLSRLLGLGVPGSLVATVCLLWSGWFWTRASCCPVEAGVAAWLPVALIGVEQALRARNWSGRVLWWIFAGASVSQVLALSFGPATYYALLAVAAYLGYRALFSPVRNMSWPARFANVGLHGGAIFLLGVCLAALVALPRLEYLGQSNLEGGYQSWEGVRGGWGLGELGERTLGRTSYYAGASTIVFAVAGLVLARRRLPVLFLSGVTFAALLLSLRDPTPIQWIAHLILPKFEELHRNLPQRIMQVFYLPVALLAGFAVEAILAGQSSRKARRITVGAGVVVVLLAVWWVVGDSVVGWESLVFSGMAVAVIAVCLFTKRTQRSAIVLPIIATVLIVDLVLAGADIVESGRAGLLQPEVELGNYYDETPAARFLLDLQAASPEPFRFLSYAPGVLRGESDDDVLYRYSFHRRTAAWLVFNNRATVVGLDDVQGQSNPQQIERFAEYMTALNDRTQDYHDANVYPSGLDSPLLDLLNARYLILPKANPPDRTDLDQLARDLPTVYEDDHVRIVENREAYPRAWIVHDAQPVERGEALPLLSNGTVDPGQTALIEGSVPELGMPVAGAQERATVTTRDPSRMVIETATDAPGLLVLSEISYPAWHAYVDGERVDVLVANHAFRAVPIPAGGHTVELRYESRSFAVGLAVTSVAVFGCIVALGAVVYARLHRRHDSR